MEERDEYMTEERRCAECGKGFRVRYSSLRRYCPGGQCRKRRWEHKERKEAREAAFAAYQAKIGKAASETGKSAIPASLRLAESLEDEIARMERELALRASDPEAG